MKNLLPIIKQNLTILAAGIFFEIIFLLFFLIEPLRHYLGDASATLHNNFIFITLVLALAFQCFIYISLRQTATKNNFKIILIFFLLFNATLLFVWPIASNDLFVYISQGRLISFGHLNPYAHSYSSFSNDVLFNQINTPWTNNHTSIYGPIFLIISAILTPLGGNSLILSIFIFKLFFVFLNIVCGYLIYRITEKTEIFFLYAWNPLILFELAANGHNDVITIFLLLLSLFFIVRKNNRPLNIFYSYIFLVLSALIKYFTLPLLPIYALATSAAYESWKEKAYYLLKLAVITLAILFLSFCLFWEGPNTFLDLNKYIIGNQTRAIWCPFIIVLYLLVPQTWNQNYIQIIYFTGKAVFLFFYLLLFALIAKDGKQAQSILLVKYFSITIFIFLTFFFTWLVPWYFTILITLLILYYGFSQSKLSLLTANFFLFYGVLYYLILR